MTGPIAVRSTQYGGVLPGLPDALSPKERASFLFTSHRKTCHDAPGAPVGGLWYVRARDVDTRFGSIPSSGTRCTSQRSPALECPLDCFGAPLQPWRVSVAWPRCRPGLSHRISH